MKRSPINKVSKKNSKKHVNRVLWQKYTDAHDKCELIHLFPGTSLFAHIEIGERLFDRVPRRADAEEVHHIAGGANGADRVDSVTNMIRVCLPVHRWCEKFRRDQFWLCARVKLDKGEFDFFEMNRILGLNRPHASCVHFFDIKPPRLEWVAPIRESVIRDVEARWAS